MLKQIVADKGLPSLRPTLLMVRRSTANLPSLDTVIFVTDISYRKVPNGVRTLASKCERCSTLKVIEFRSAVYHIR